MLRGLGWRLDAAWHGLIGEVAAKSVQAAAAMPQSRNLPRWAVAFLERLLITRCGPDLFNAEFYRRRNADVDAAEMDPLSHYLSHGWREGRAPNPHFDDAYYRAVSGLPLGVPVSPLAHYMAVGCRRGFAPAPAADAGLLSRASPALEVARLDGYRGLLGGAIQAPEEGRPDLQEVLRRVATLEHRSIGIDPVDVVMPVYGGRAETLNAIFHALTARNDTAAEIVVVDDKTPDGDLARDLDSLAERGLVTLIRHTRNLGFVASINDGGALHPDRDVIWLNADTEVYDGWIDRLRATAYSREQVATVTPLTNNGTICSYPRSDADNPGELELPWPAIDRIAADVNRGSAVESPTAVGFATYVRRAALDAVGPLDTATFGRGYGEENDFSQRAIKAGWTNLLAADVVVRHFGATSFRGERPGRVAAAMRIMDRLHPDYRASVARFVALDPLAEARRRLDLARLTAGGSRPSVLLISHSLGGGTAQHVHEETERLTAAGWTVYLLTGGEGGPGTARLCRAGAGPMPGLATLELDGDRLWEIIDGLSLDRVDVHHLIDFVAEAPEILRRRITAAGLSYQVVVHDYFPVCPRINMADQGGLYCREPGSGRLPALCRPAGLAHGAAGHPGVARALRGISERSRAGSCPGLRRRRPARPLLPGPSDDHCSARFGGSGPRANAAPIRRAAAHRGRRCDRSDQGV